MIKLFSNTVIQYLESDFNSFIKSSKCTVINIQYNTLIVDEELVHNIMLHYTIPTE